MNTALNVVFYGAVPAALIFGVLLIRKAFRKDRAHGKRIARYEALSDPSRPYAGKTHFDRGDDDYFRAVRQMLRENARDLDLPPGRDPMIVDRPEPHREEGPR